jgi:BASS family bile acid:Na+ symporter
MADTSDRLKHLWGVYGRTGALLAAIVGGIGFPEAHTLVFLVPYLVALMLFFSFVDLSIGGDAFERGVWRVLVANVAIAFLGYLLLLPVSLDLALVAFFAGVSPTAVSAPVLIGLLGGRVQYVVASVLLTNIVMAFILPFVLPIVAGRGVMISALAVVQSVVLIVFVPMGAARAVRYLPTGLGRLVRMGKAWTFYALPPSIFLTTARASFFIRHEVTASAGLLAGIALVSLVVCVVNFVVGAIIGGRGRTREGSQALGQKNNSFTIWLALAFVSPLAALGPTFYVVYHNVYNSFQLYRFQKRQRPA